MNEEDIEPNKYPFLTLDDQFKQKYNDHKNRLCERNFEIQSALVKWEEATEITKLKIRDHFDTLFNGKVVPILQKVDDLSEMIKSKMHIAYKKNEFYSSKTDEEIRKYETLIENLNMDDNYLIRQAKEDDEDALVIDSEMKTSEEEENGIMNYQITFSIYFDSFINY
jgi:hypothetical protein